MLSDELESKPELLVQFVQNTFIPLGKGFEEPEQGAAQSLPSSKVSENTLENQAPVVGDRSTSDSDSGLPIQTEAPDARGVTTASESVDGSTPWYLRVQELAHDSLVAATRAELVKDSKGEPTNDSKTSSRKEDLTPDLQHTAPRSEKTLKCCYDGCSRTFLWHAHLKYHLKTHKNDRSFTCPKEGCGKSFYVLQRLKVHMRTHNGEKPYTCPETDCGKKFTTAGNLKNHMRIHTGEKPYHCSICSKTFSQSGSRNVHLRKYHNVLVPVTDQEEAREATPLADTGAANEPEIPVGLAVATATVTTPASLETQPLVLPPSILGAEEEVLPENSPSVTGSATTASIVVLPQPHHLVTIATAGHSYEEVVTVIIQ
ncbi:zinc finger protein 410 isoform X2 [Stegostoma tigrinum]|uniref:zinc finger protein 410 isoform X2 n=1 Tax=Stegostoma tigrinum TaxID=3053191 RepID=UPI00202B79F7|nr:zinc finger protein 410 isoform X2 [Stegostoma tigrinum]